MKDVEKETRRDWEGTERKGTVGVRRSENVKRQHDEEELWEGEGW